MRIKSLQKLIDLLRGKRRTKTKFNIVEIQTKQKEIICKLKNKNKIRVCFLVIFDSVFSSQSVYEEMLKDSFFEPFILVIPDTSRGTENMFYQMDKTYKTLSSKYDNVKFSYDKDSETFIDFSESFDIAFFNNPYDSMTHDFYKIETLSNKDILTCYTDYGYVVSNLHYSLYDNVEYNSLWKIFALEKYQFDKIKQNVSKGYNVVLSGYAKLDKYYNCSILPREKKKIIIAPHHTVNFPNLALSNFLIYSEFFIEIFKKYTQVDFVFRPHPLLFVTLSKNNLWGKDKVKDYINKLTVLPNVEFQNGGEYLETFANSDGLIHDCGSYMAEYLFTGKPCCYLLKEDKKVKTNPLNIFAQECVKRHYHAFNEKDILYFIDEIILKENDIRKKEREEFFINNLKINYPNTAKFILRNIKEELRGEVK